MAADRSAIASAIADRMLVRFASSRLICRSSDLGDFPEKMPKSICTVPLPSRRQINREILGCLRREYFHEALNVRRPIGTRSTAHDDGRYDRLFGCRESVRP